MRLSKGEKTDKKKYQLPDGKTIEMTNEQHEAPEILFNTALIGRDGESVQHLIVNALETCDIDTRKQLSENVILAGGSVSF